MTSQQGTGKSLSFLQCAFKEFHIPRAGPCIRRCILYSGQVHVLADVFYTVHVFADVVCIQGRSMYSLMQAILREGHVFADVLCTQGKSMY